MITYPVSLRWILLLWARGPAAMLPLWRGLTCSTNKCQDIPRVVGLFKMSSLLVTCRSWSPVVLQVSVQSHKLGMDLCGWIGYFSIVVIKHHYKGWTEGFIWASHRCQRVRVHSDEMASQQVADIVVGTGSWGFISWAENTKQRDHTGKGTRLLKAHTPQWYTSSSKPCLLNLPK